MENTVRQTTPTTAQTDRMSEMDILSHFVRTVGHPPVIEDIRLIMIQNMVDLGHSDQAQILAEKLEMTQDPSVKAILAPSPQP